jgi:V8-like Glu-specific endopeptidase
VSRPHKLRTRIIGVGLAVGTVAALGGTQAYGVAGGGSTVATYGFVAKLQVGDIRSCSGVLVAPRWVLTSASCFADGAQPPVAGPPALATTAIIGRTDLSHTDGHVTTVVSIDPRTDRDATLVELSDAIADVTPVRLAAAGAALGDTVTSAGFGRTSTEWAPNQQHSAQFSVDGIDANLLGLASGTPDATLCKGDAGGPLLRENSGVVSLVGINTASWQRGCLDADPAETRQGATATRVDDLAGWIADHAVAFPRDFNSDDKSDVAGIDANNNMQLYPGNGHGQLTAGSLMWATGGKWVGFHGIAAGDFNGDGNVDIAGIDANNNLQLYPGSGHGQLGAGSLMWATGGQWINFHGIAAGDFNGDGNVDIAGIDANNNMQLYPGNGHGQLTAGSLMWATGGQWVNFHGFTAGDFNGDGNVDIAGIDANNNMQLYPGNGHGQLTAGSLMWATGGKWAGFHGIA